MEVALDLHSFLNSMRLRQSSSALCSLTACVPSLCHEFDLVDCWSMGLQELSPAKVSHSTEEILDVHQCRSDGQEIWVSQSL